MKTWKNLYPEICSFEKTFIYDSYACRKGKGTHAAADRYTEYSRRARYVLKCDLSRYLASVRHDILFDMFKRKIAGRMCPVPAGQIESPVSAGW